MVLVRDRHTRASLSDELPIFQTMIVSCNVRDTRQKVVERVRFGRVHVMCVVEHATDFECEFIVFTRVGGYVLVKDGQPVRERSSSELLDAFHRELAIEIRVLLSHVRNATANRRTGTVAPRQRPHRPTTPHVGAKDADGVLRKLTHTRSRQTKKINFNLIKIKLVRLFVHTHVRFAPPFQSIDGLETKPFTGDVGRVLGVFLHTKPFRHAQAHFRGRGTSSHGRRRDGYPAAP